MRRGLTIIEIVIVMALLSIMMLVGLTALNPAGQLASARNSQRNSHVNSIILAVRANMADNQEVFSCASGNIPTSTKRMAVGSSTYYNIGQCLVPMYMVNLPFDPSVSGAHWVSIVDYDTGYNIIRNASTGEVTISAPYAELGKTISVTR